MAILPDLIYRFNAIPAKIPCGISAEMNFLVLKIIQIWEIPQ
jgi:hypothetical protein